MKKLNLKRLPFLLPLFSIYFIEEKKDGVLYHNQTGGCSCNHRSIRGRLYEFAKNDKKIEVFNPNWWYGHFYREKGILANKYVTKRITPHTIGHWEQLINQQEKEIANHPKLLTWAKLKTKVERALNKIKSKDISKIKILGNFYSPYEYPPDRNEEAWIHAQINFKNGGMKTGVFTWQNCD